mgnify:CR=1 FL=1
MKKLSGISVVLMLLLNGCNSGATNTINSATNAANLNSDNSLTSNNTSMAGAVNSTYSLTINNNSNAPVMLSWNAGKNTSTIIPAGKSTVFPAQDVGTIYQVITQTITGGSTQIVTSLKQDASWFSIQNTSPAYNQALQAITVSYTSGSYSGSYASMMDSNGYIPRTGFCNVDGSAGTTCQASSNISNPPTQITLNLSGGTSPNSYLQPLVAWDSNAIYQVTYNPTTYPLVSYKNQQYVACWYASSANVPGAGDPWRVYNPSTSFKNPCSN